MFLRPILEFEEFKTTFNYYLVILKYLLPSNYLKDLTALNPMNRKSGKNKVGNEKKKMKSCNDI